VLAANGGFQGAVPAPGQLPRAQAAPAMNNQEVARLNLFVSLTNTVGVMLVMALVLAQIVMSIYK
jgi:hypothetical protein